MSTFYATAVCQDKAPIELLDLLPHLIFIPPDVGIKVSKVVPIHRLANQNHIMILAVLKHVEATKQLQPCLEVGGKKRLANATGRQANEDASNVVTTLG